MLRRRRSDEETPVGEANVLPIMNIMFLLIPALLLAMEAASMASVTVSPPRFSPSSSQVAEPTEPEKSLELTVMIQSDGFRVTHAGQQAGAEVGRAQDSSLPTISLAKPDAPLTDYARYDYVALEDLARELKDKHQTETVVRVSAENDIPAQVLVSTLDALRGSDCRLAQVKADEQVPAECLFFRPVVQAGV
jgi:biopolymer transport protein ExbD